MRPRPVTALLLTPVGSLILALPAPAQCAPQLGPSSSAQDALPPPAAVGLTRPPAPDLAPAAADAGPDRLVNPPTRRGYGLPVALAAVLVGGVASLLVRVLLAEPAARRRAPDPAGREPVTAGDGADGARSLRW